MLKKILLSTALVLGAAAPAFAQGAACADPGQPAAVVGISSMDGATVSKTDLLAGRDAYVKFEADSDTYQKCLQSNFDAQAAAAKASNTQLDPSIEKDMKAKGIANETLKETTGVKLNAVIAAYQKAHPPAK